MYYDLYKYFTDMPKWHVYAIVLIGYLSYYLIQVVKRPILAVTDGPFKSYLRSNVPILELKYWPTFWCVESRAQTVFASILRSQVIPRVDYRRELLTLKDGGEVALDWMENNCKPDAPIILILPGLTGESQAEYIKCLVIAANQIGLRTVVFNNRGLGGVTLKTPRLYCASNCEDLSEVVNHVKRTNPNVKLGATGISMGGLILGNYLAVHSEEARGLIAAAKIISVPWDVHKGTASIEKPFINNLLGRHLTSSLCETVSKYEMLKDEPLVDMSKVMQSRTIKEFDAHFTSKHFGFEGVEQYYDAATLHNKLHKISVPLLCLSAADDPFQPLEAIPIKDAEKSSHVAIVVTARGGHIGFLEGWWPSSKDQYMGRLFSQYFNSVLYDINNEFEQTSSEMLSYHLKSN